MFKKRTANTFTRDVTVYFPDNTKGTYEAEFEYLDQEQYESLLSESESTLVDRVLKCANRVADEDGNPITGEEARTVILGDACAVAATAMEYIDAMKGRNLRRGRKF